MRPILLDNAIEAWKAAIRFCNDIKRGKATLQYQKNFVSSLHNAVELIMKQMLLNNNDHRVAEIRQPNNESEAKLLLDYFKATDLNYFFDTLPNESLSKFHTIGFEKLISLREKIFGHCLEQGEQGKLLEGLQLLKRRRNDETHFMIRQGSFLSERDFCVLHNFMIKFYKIMKTWWPTSDCELESNIFLYIDWFSLIKDDSIYRFDCEPLQDFSYKDAVRNSRLAKEIAEILKENHLIGAYDCSSFGIADDLRSELSVEFDEIWTMVSMMKSLDLIVVDKIQDEQGNTFNRIKVLL